MNKELLFQLYAMHSPSGGEKKMRRLLRRKAFEFGADSAETDKYGNLLIVKGKSDTYPCVAAHMDQVQDFHSKDFTVVEIGGDLIGWSPRSHKQQGLGADDKNGIYICLEMLRRFDAIKVAFFVGEEVGCKGSSQVDLKFFEDCRFIIEPDRRGSSDLITSMFCGGVCSDKFIEDIHYKDYGYKETSGTVTDVGELTERGVGISCLNLSCGYYEAHTDHEITVLPDLANCLEFVSDIIENCTAVYPFEGGRSTYYSGYSGYGGMSRGLYGYGYGSYGSKKYDSWYDDDKWWKKEQVTEEVDSEDEYYNAGYYDEDCGTMSEYLEIQPDLTFDQVLTFCAEDFHATHMVSDYASVLRDLYEMFKWEDDPSCVWPEWEDDVKKVS